jgi:hypothetical protein
MSKQTIIVTIDEKAVSTTEVKGVKGKACVALTADVEAALGGKVLDRTETKEMHEQGQATVQEHIRQ